MDESPRDTTSRTLYLLERIIGGSTKSARPYCLTGNGIVQRPRRAWEVLPHTSKSASSRPFSMVTFPKKMFASTCVREYGPLGPLGRE